MPSTKPRIHPYISEDSYGHLRAWAKRPGRNESEIVDAALAAYFSHEYDDKRDGALVRRLDRMTRQIEELKRNQIISSEAFSLYIRYFLTVIPPVDEPDKKAAQSQGQARFESYLQSLKTVLDDGERCLFGVMDDVMVDETAFFTTEELARLGKPTKKTEASYG